jgi:hypothetical protein
MHTYRITLLGAALDSNTCPPSILLAVFPQWNGEIVDLTPERCLVTFATPQAPADLGPLVKVELVTSE